MDIDEYSDFETTRSEDGIDDANDVDVPVKKYSAFQQARYKKLGFHPQKEIFCNKYLPYADQLDDESQKMLTELKEGLAKAVVLREMTPAVGKSISRLLVYVFVDSINLHMETVWLNAIWFFRYTF